MINNYKLLEDGNTLAIKAIFTEKYDNSKSVCT